MTRQSLLSSLLWVVVAPGCGEGSTSATGQPGGSETGGEGEAGRDSDPRDAADGTGAGTGDGADSTSSDARGSDGDAGESGTATGTTSGGPDGTDDGAPTTGDPECDEATFACSDCDAVVPDDFDTIGEAVAAVGSPGQVCVRAGTYAEDVVMRPHVSLTGVGPQTRIDGVLRIHEMPHDDPTPTLVTDLSVVAPVWHAVSGCADAGVDCLFDYDGWLHFEGQTLALDFERVELQGDTGRHCFLLLVTGDVHVGFHDSVCRGGRGIRLRQFTDPDLPKTTVLRVTRSRFVPSDDGPDAWAAHPIFLSSGSPIGDVVTAADPAMRVHLEITDSMFVKMFGDLSITFGAFWPNATDSSATIAHNTMSLKANPGFPDNGAAQFIDNSGTIPIVYANNLVYGFTSHLSASSMAPTEMIGNLVAPAEAFVDADAGDLRLAEDAAAIDAADVAHATPFDVFGQPRPVDGDGDGVAIADVGAHERGGGAR